MSHEAKNRLRVLEITDEDVEISLEVDAVSADYNLANHKLSDKPGKGQESAAAGLGGDRAYLTKTSKPEGSAATPPEGSPATPEYKENQRTRDERNNTHAEKSDVSASTVELMEADPVTLHSCWHQTQFRHTVPMVAVGPIHFGWVAPGWIS